MIYHGGPVMTAPVKLYYIWYGNWGNDSAIPILDDLAAGIGGGSYFGINTTYRNGANVAVQNAVSYGGQVFDVGSLGTALAPGDVGRIVSNALSSGVLPSDPNAIYMVLTSPEISEGEFCSYYCGYHTYVTVGATTIKYAFIGNGSACPLACPVSDNQSPNRNRGADEMASVIAHEISEAVTDPQLNAWYDGTGYENADKCAWMWGTTYTSSSGFPANAHFGNRDYLVQMNWINGVNGMCANELIATTVSCTDGARQVGETDVDCGGACPGCDYGKSCISTSDCAVGGCFLGKCTTGYCFDLGKDYDESDVDCGGSCAGCALGKACTITADCVAGASCLNGLCVPHCSSTTRDYDETDVDCGGPTCAHCALGQRCRTTADCGAGACSLGKCSLAYCHDTVRDNDETDVDCGGLCAGCAIGKRCTSTSSCAVGACLLGKCSLSYCIDSVRDYDETDVDCGGSCGGCALGKRCTKTSNCATGACFLGKCSIAYCTDTVIDYDETDVDCGGSCAHCAAGKRCVRPADCLSGVCSAVGLCQ